MELTDCRNREEIEALLRMKKSYFRASLVVSNSANATPAAYRVAGEESARFAAEIKELEASLAAATPKAA